MTNVKAACLGIDNSGKIPCLEEIMMEQVLFRALTDDHRRCDSLLAAAETATTGKDWAAIVREIEAVREAVERHFQFEEQVLFPQLEALVPMAGGPAGVMRMEHQQIRQLMTELANAAQMQDKETCVGTFETLHMMTQQHNAKEEAILYPMADNVLQGQAESMAATLAEY